jgi:hypothetical protein
MQFIRVSKETKMSENQEVEVLAEVPAPEQEVTTAPESDAVEVELSEEKPAEPAKVFTQEELDAAIGKRLAREQRKWEREQRAAQVSQPVTSTELPAPDQFETVEAYAEALALKKAEDLIAQREQQRQQVEILESYHDKEEEARSKYDDFEQVAYNPSVPITQVMAQTIQASDIGPDVAYYLGANIKEAERISKLPPFLQAKEIGKLEVTLTNEPVTKKTTSAPAPISPVTAKGSGSPAYDTTDPRSTKSMSTSEWIAAERARQVKAWEAKHR